MEEKNVPYLTVESMQARNIYIVSKLIRVIIILVITILLNNGLWIYCMLQYNYDDVTTATETDTVNVDSEGNGIANYIGNDGEISYGESYSDENPNNNSQENTD